MRGCMGVWVPGAWGYGYRCTMGRGTPGTMAPLHWPHWPHCTDLIGLNWPYLALFGLNLAKFLKDLANLALFGLIGLNWALIGP